MERFDVLFAQRFLNARNAWNSGSVGVPASWQLAFETAQRRRSLVAQHLLLGINAHINLDLGVAAASAAPPGEVEALRDDFETINDVLAELVDRMQASLAAVSPRSQRSAHGSLDPGSPSDGSSALRSAASVTTSRV